MLMKFQDDDSIRKLILARVVLPKETEETIAHHPSGLMGCMRARYYNWMSREDMEKEYGAILKDAVIDEDWLRRQSIFALGNAVEADLGNWLSMAGLLPSPNRRQYRIRSRKYLISGNIDFLISLEGKDIPIECKSCNSMSFQTWQGWFCSNCGEKLRQNAKACPGCNMGRPKMEHKVKKEGFDMSPSIEHYSQLQAYLNVGGFDHGYLYYHNKDNSETRWYKILKDEFFWGEILKQNEKLMEAVRTRAIPPRQYSAVFDINGDINEKDSDWHCRFCDWNRICWWEVIQQHLSDKEKEIARLFSTVKGGGGS